MNPTTRRYPRTMQEAFGPYTSRGLHLPRPPYDAADRIVVAACLLAVAAVGVLVLCGVIT